MKLTLFLALSIGLVFAVQTVLITNEREEINVIGDDDREAEKITTDEATQTEDDVDTNPRTSDILVEVGSENFETPDSIEEIRHDLQLSQQTVQILRQPFSLANGIENELDSLLETLTSQDKYTSDQNEPSSESEQQYPLEIIHHEIHSRKNPILETTPDDLLAPDDGIPAADFVADELTDLTKNEIQPQSKPITECSKILAQIDKYTTPDIDRNLIESFQGPVDRTWQGPDYQIRFKRDFPKGETELWWKKGQDDIYLHRFANGAVDQNWGFGDVHIGLFRDEDGKQMQFWNFGNTKLEYIVGENPSYSRVWEFGNRDEASFWKYRHVIKLWCKANDFFVGGESCIIY